MKLSKSVYLLILILICVPVHAAERIVSIGGSITEILFQLGLEDKIVAVDTTSQYPQATKDMKNVGYMRALSAEPIMALNPDLIIYQEDAGPVETIEHLQASGMKLVKVSNKHSIQGVLKKVSEVSKAVNMESQGQELIEDIRQQLNKLPQYDNASAPRVMFILSFDKASALVAGKQTGADGIIELAGGDNVINDFNSYKPLSAEAIIKSAPDFILTTHRAVASVGSEEDVLALPALRLTPAARNKQIIVMDGLLLLGFGPRIAHAAYNLSSAIYSIQ